MSIKQTNRFLLYSVVIGLIFDMVLSSFVFSGSGWDISSVLKYLTIGTVGVVMVRKSGDRVLDYLPVDVPMKPQTAFVVLILMFMTYPVCEVLSQLGGWLSGNAYDAVIAYRDQNMEQTFLQRLFAGAILPAVFEEMIYRGFLYQGYKKGKGVRTAILLTAFLFGTFHMIFQQAVYAAFAGLMLAIVRELTGSMWPGMWYHFLNNEVNKVAEKIIEYCPGFEKFSVFTYLNFDTKTNGIITTIAALIGLPLSYLCLKKIASIEGRDEDLRILFRKEEGSDEKLITASLVIAVMIEIAAMVAIGVMVKMMKNFGLM